MDDLIWRSGFGIMNLLEVEQVNQDKWNEYIARNTECKTWHEFGKLAKENNTMIIPGNLADVSGMIASAMATLKHSQGHPAVQSGAAIDKA